MVVLGAFAVLALPAPAQAASPGEIHSDCGEPDGTLDRQYSKRDLRRARDTLPTDLDEYSDCREVIAAALKGGSDQGGGRGSPGIGGLDPAGEAAARATDEGALGDFASGAAGAPSVDVGGIEVKPGADGLFDLASASNRVPMPLLLALIVLGLLALAGAVPAARERLPALARLPLLEKIPAPRVPFSRRG